MRSIYIILSFLLIFTGYMIFRSQPTYQLSRGEQLVNSVLAKTAKIIKSRLGLKPTGEGAAMPGGPVQKLILCFDTSKPHNKEQLRELLIKSAEELLDQVNKNDEFQKYLKERPFTIKNLQIIIYNHDKEGRQLYEPGIATAQISGGILTYRTVDSTNTYQFKRQFEESYEEALNLYRSY